MTIFKITFHSWKSFFTRFCYQNWYTLDWLMCSCIFRRLFSKGNTSKLQKEVVLLWIRKCLETLPRINCFSNTQIRGEKTKIWRMFYSSLLCLQDRYARWTPLPWGTRNKAVKVQSDLFMPHGGITLRATMAITWLMSCSWQHCSLLQSNMLLRYSKSDITIVNGEWLVPREEIRVQTSIAKWSYK